MAEFRMPSLGADMEAGTLVEWKVKPGDPIKRGDVICEVVTEKGDIEVESWLTGTVEQLVVNVGEKVPVKTLMAIIRTDGEEPKAQPVATPAHRQWISPAARRRMEAAGLDAANIKGTGFGGAITIADVEKAQTGAQTAAQTAAPMAAQTRVSAPHAPQDMRHAIARAMARSKREIPHYYLTQRIDLSHALAWLEAENAKRELPRRLLYSVLLLKAVALAVHDVPEMNGFWEDDQWRSSEAVHIGVATSLRSGGLIAPAIHDAAKKSIDELMQALQDLVNRVRNGGLRSSELSDPTITVTSLGERGCDSVMPIIYPPQVAIVGFGAIVEEAWAEHGMVGARRVIHATLGGDHRASDGHRGALFLRAVESLLQSPEHL